MLVKVLRDAVTKETSWEGLPTPSSPGSALHCLAVCKKEPTYTLRFRTNVSDPLLTKLIKSKGQSSTVRRLMRKNAMQNGKDTKNLFTIGEINLCTLNTLTEMYIIDKDITA